jgi:hypothetical protein
MTWHIRVCLVTTQKKRPTSPARPDAQHDALSLAPAVRCVTHYARCAVFGTDLCPARTCASARDAALRHSTALLHAATRLPGGAAHAAVPNAKIQIGGGGGLSPVSSPGGGGMASSAFGGVPMRPPNRSVRGWPPGVWCGFA